MSKDVNATDYRSSRSLHQLGVMCGLAAGAWLGAAEAPTKLVTVGFSPFVISLGMVAGVFAARWTVPVVLKGSAFVLLDLKTKPHLIVWAILAGTLWAVANTLTIFAIRDVGLSIAFPLWNVNSLVGLFWGWLLFNELRRSGKRLGQGARWRSGHCARGVSVGLRDPAPYRRSAEACHARGRRRAGAGLLWGTMYIPYRKAYISGMNPLSFVTVFTVGELVTVIALGAVFHGGLTELAVELGRARPVLFWLFLGGFCWVLGDLFQQYAAKYIGIGRGIPLSNTNQLWGLAWGALVFGELAGLGTAGRLLVVGGSLIMVVGAVSISLAEATASEQASWQRAVERECARYQLDRSQVAAVLRGEEAFASRTIKRSWWEAIVVCAAIGLFVWLAFGVTRQQIAIHTTWLTILAVLSLGFLAVGAAMLWHRTRFS